MSGNSNATAEKEPSVPRMSRLLKETVLPAVVSEGVFGDGWAVDDVQSAPIGGLGEDHWASTTLSTTVSLRRADGEQRSAALVSKCMLPGDSFDIFYDVDVQADNEVNMYTKVFPFFKRLAESSGVPVDDVSPKCYWARSHADGLLSLTIMEDLREKGFRLAKERTALDRQHVSLALRAIGRMHAWSYAAKARCREEFLQRVVPLLGESTYTDRWHREQAPMLNRVVLRGIDGLEQRLGAAADPVRLERLRRMRARLEDVFVVMSDAAAPREPVAVVAHGDFCRNNMQFRYERQGGGEAGRPLEVCLFDFQNSRYCSPALDLSFFLLLNTSAELRAAHWDELLQEYYDSLKCTVDRLLVGHDAHPDFVMPTLQTIKDEMKQHALYGFVIISFFLPQMMTPPEEMMSIEEAKRLMQTDFNSLTAEMLRMGGEAASQALADMVLQLVDKDLVP